MSGVAGKPSETERAESFHSTAKMRVLDDATLAALDAEKANDAGPDQESPHVDPTIPVVNHLGSAVVAALAGAGLTVADRYGAGGLLVGIAVTQGLLVLAWVFGTALPGRIGGIVVGALAAGGADFAVSRWPHGQLGTLLAVLALAVPVMFVHQLSRGVVRARVVESLSDISVMVVAVVAMSALAQLRHETDGSAMVTAVVLAAAGALVVGHLVDMVAPVPRFDPMVPRGLLAVVVGAAVGAAIGYLRLHDTIEFTSNRSVYLGASVGAVVSLFAVGAAYVQRGSPPRGRVRAVARNVSGVLLSLSLLAPVGYLLCLVIRG
jgi:hypothetical protein